MYYFIGIKGTTGKMSGSSGLNLTPETLLKIYQQYRKLPSGRTAQQLRDQNEDHVLTLDSAETLILGNGYRRKVTLKSKRIDRIFPPEYDGEQIEEIIYELLERWKSEQA